MQFYLHNEKDHLAVYIFNVSIEIIYSKAIAARITITPLFTVFNICVWGQWHFVEIFIEQTVSILMLSVSKCRKDLFNFRIIKTLQYI